MSSILQNVTASQLLLSFSMVGMSILLHQNTWAWAVTVGLRICNSRPVKGNYNLSLPWASTETVPLRLTQPTRLHQVAELAILLLLAHQLSAYPLRIPASLHHHTSLVMKA